MQDQLLNAARAEFADIGDPAGLLQVVVRLLLAVALSGAIGYERERRGSAAGFRTHMLVGLGSALFVLVPLRAGMSMADLSRVLQGVVAGVGFLGAGAILKLNEPGEVRGLTTAASVWATAALGVTCAMGHALTAILTAALVLVILALTPQDPPPPH